jgi:4-amino-4-deoxy-L-arabinose transferase-like glycosyltransferase
MQDNRETRTETLVGWLVGIGLAALALLMLANSMAKPETVSRDEQMYCTGGVLTAGGQTIYRDFSYIAQPPYHAVLLAAFYKIAHTHRYLLVGRLVSVACDVLILVFLFLIYRLIFGRARVAGALFGLAAATLYVFNPLADYTAGYAWNQDAMMACIMASLWLFLRMATTESPNRYLRIGGIVVLLTAATCMRITAGLVELVFLIAILAGLGGTLRQKIQTTAAFAGIALVVAAWPIRLLMRDPQAVWLNLVQIPLLCAQWLNRIGRVYDKGQLAYACLTAPAYIALLALVVLSGILFVRRWRSLDKPTKGHFILTLALPIVLIAIAFVPPTMWLQYWGVPVPFLTVALAFPLAQLTRSGWRKAEPILLSLCVLAGVIVAVVTNPDVLRQSAILLVPERWGPVRLHATAEKIAAQTKGSGPILTLSPLYALEAGRRIYPELSCADFAYRVADSLSAEERRIAHTVGPAGIAEMIADHPPAAILVGAEPAEFASLEEPLRRAVPAGWSGIDCGDGLRLYVPPGEAPASSTPDRTRR